MSHYVHADYVHTVCNGVYLSNTNNCNNIEMYTGCFVYMKVHCLHVHYIQILYVLQYLSGWGNVHIGVVLL